MKNKDIKEAVRNMTLEEKCYLLSGKDFWQSRSVKRLGIPNVTLSDGPHGIRKQEGASDQLGLNGSVPATCYPTAATVANSWDPALGEEIGQCLGEEAAFQDVCVLLGPGMNIKRNPFCGRNFEYFSEDPYLAGKMAAGCVRGIQSQGVGACPKHFAANSQEIRRMASDSVVDERTLREIYLTGFEIAVREAKPRSIMSSYNRINGVYANENEHLLQEILRDEWGFDGFVVSDWGASNDHVAGVAAGSHLEMPTTGGDSDEELIQAVKDGKISEAMIDRRVTEFLEATMSCREAVDKVKGRDFDQEAHHKMAQKAAEQSIVLLKNENDILPLAEGTKVAVIGDFAETPRYQGAGSSVVNPKKIDSTIGVIGDFPLIMTAYAKGYPRTGPADDAMEKGAVEAAQKADVVLLYIGLDEISESEGLDREHMRIPDSQVRLLHKVAKVNPHVVAVLSGGSAIEMDWIDDCEAVIHGYLSGQAGAAAMLNALLGRVNPSGKLNETYPFKYEDTPSAPYFPAKQRNAEYREGLYVGYRYFTTAKVPVRFPFGYGLSYTTFAYSDLKVGSMTTKGTKEKAGQRNAIACENPVVTFTLANTGDRDGAEVVQVYVGAKDGSVYRPERELKGFQKVFLKAGESKTVTIALDDKAFRYFNTKTGRFEIDGGEYNIMVGASCEDIRLETSVMVEGSGAPAPIALKDISAYAKCDIAAVSDDQFAKLLGHEILDGSWSGTLEENDAISQLYYAKGGVARLIYMIMTNMLDKSMAKGKPDLNIMFIYNMPFRGIGKMAGGICSQYMVEGILKAVNGHFFGGLGQIISGFFRQRKVKKKADSME
ncbi:MAG: glycoside hydrolase family 3 C-terminal domain-containing protein [Clostridiales bacterium]|nr:glycoside hydrolase family 3 C-terminal domain-containing protein [Clostridiales bacterium]